MDEERGTAIRRMVAAIVHRTPVYDIHTHLYEPAFGELLLWGIGGLVREVALR